MTSRNTIPAGVFARDKGNRPLNPNYIEFAARIMQQQAEERQRLDSEWDDHVAAA